MVDCCCCCLAARLWSISSLSLSARIKKFNCLVWNGPFYLFDTHRRLETVVWSRDEPPLTRKKSSYRLQWHSDCWRNERYIMQIIERNRFRAFFFFTCKSLRTLDFSLHSIVHRISRRNRKKKVKKETSWVIFFIKWWFDVGLWVIWFTGRNRILSLNPLSLTHLVLIVMHRLARSERKK